MIIGCVSGMAIGLITEYYTGSTFSRKISKSCESGAATNIIYGLSIGMESVALPVILLGLRYLVPLCMAVVIYMVLPLRRFLCWRRWYYDDR